MTDASPTSQSTAAPSPSPTPSSTKVVHYIWVKAYDPSQADPAGSINYWAQVGYCVIPIANVESDGTMMVLMASQPG